MRSPERFHRDSVRIPVGVQSDPGRDGTGARDGTREGKGYKAKERKQVEIKSPCPSPSVVVLRLPESSDILGKVHSILQGGLDSLDLNDYGLPWPPIRRSALVALCSRYDDDLCRKAAWEAREIVQAQDRAPNITGLFAKKLAELAEIRNEVRESFEGAA